MTQRYSYIFQIFAMVGGFALFIGWALSANNLDEALKGGDFRKVLDILGPGKVEEISGQENDLEEMEPVEVDEQSKSPRRGVIRMPSNRSSKKTTKPTSAVRNKDVKTAREPRKQAAPPKETPVAASAKNQRGGKPRKALSVDQPAQVPMTRSRVSYISAKDLRTENPSTNRTGQITIVDPSIKEPEPTVERQAPEDRNKASAELVALLKEMNTSPEPVKESASLAVSTETPTALQDEDLDRSKPLAMPKRRSGASTGTALRASSLRAPTKTIQSAAANDGSERRPQDIIRNTRSDLEDLLRDAKNGSFVGTVSTKVPSSQPAGGIPAGGWQYEGQWRNGRMDGYGVLTYPDGWRYEGEWQNGQMIGQGTLSHPDGWQYTGAWRDGKMDGEGVLTYPDGWKYVGQWREGKMHGTGELVHPDE